MRMKAILVAALVFGLGAPAVAQERVTLGWGRMFTNDAIGDGHDRWRSSSYTVSRVRGPDWNGDLPRFGEILEFRARMEFIAPDNLVTSNPNDRRYAGVLTLGLHTHFEAAGLETSFGLDLAITGEQSGMSKLHDGLHDALSLPRPRVADQQIPNAVYPTLVVETGRSFAFGRATVRPFAEAQAGLEDFIRLGADITIGSYGHGGLMIREHTSGNRYRAISGKPARGLTFTLGADVAHVFDSALLPTGGNVALMDRRDRIRLGVMWQGDRHAVHFGLTRLGKEFEGQDEAQTVGSLNFQINL